MSRFRYFIETLKLIIAYGMTGLALILPLALVYFLAFAYCRHSGNWIVATFSAVTLSIPAIFVGILISRITAITFLYFWRPE